MTLAFTRNPQHVESESMCFERRRGDDIFTFESCCKEPLSLGGQRENFKRVDRRIDVPTVLHAELGIDRELVCAVNHLRRGRQHLAQPIGGGVDVGRRGEWREPLAPPACDVRHQNVRAEVKLRLDSKNPTARTASASSKGNRQLDLKFSSSLPMRRSRPGMGVKHAENDLSDHVRRQSLDVGVGRRTCLLLEHGVHRQSERHYVRISAG